MEEKKNIKEIILIPSYEPDNKLIELIKTIDLDRCMVVVVNDGSSKKYNKIFDMIKDKVHLISYDVNMGKGYALKCGLSYIKEKYVDNYLVVTMDSDGQHTISDAIKLIDYVKLHKDTLVLGMRKRNNSTPLKSKIGNCITKGIYKLVTQINVYDTQTGLRCFTSNLTDFMLNVKGNRFEYEMNVLLYAPKSDIIIHEIEIETIYYDKNKKTHFKALRDSYLIYKDIIKYSLISVISFFLDYGFFCWFAYLFSNIIYSNILARLISTIYNLWVNKRYVFKNSWKSLTYYLLYIFITIIFNTLLLHIFVEKDLINKYIAKILVEFIFLIIVITVQQLFNRRK